MFLGLCVADASCRADIHDKSSKEVHSRYILLSSHSLLNLDAPNLITNKNKGKGNGFGAADQITQVKLGRIVQGTHREKEESGTTCPEVLVV